MGSQTEDGSVVTFVFRSVFLPRKYQEDDVLADIFVTGGRSS